MKAWQRKWHECIEKAIGQGYFLRTLGQFGIGSWSGFVNDQDQHCCAIGAVNVATGDNDGGHGSAAVFLGVPFSLVCDVELGFEDCAETPPYADADAYRFGRELRQRYVVES